MEKRFLVFGPKLELDAFEQAASDAGVTVKRQEIHQLSADVTGVAEVLKLVFSKEGAAIFVALAAIIEACLASKSSRRIRFTKIEGDNVVSFDARGFTKDELAELLTTCRELIVYDEKSKESFYSPDPRLLSDADLDERDNISFEQVKSETEEFERVLKRFDIQIANGSPLEKMCSDLRDLESGKYTIGDTMEDLRIRFRPAFGLHDLIRRIVRLQNQPDFPFLADHLRLLNKGTIAQNVVAPTDQVAAKIFELLIGLVCIEIGTETRLDGPLLSYGDNPDTLTRLDGRRWGFACKVLSGRSPKTMFDRLKEGIEQIENSPAEVGCVIINLKNQIDHEKMWPMLNAKKFAVGEETPTYGSWIDYRAPVELLRQHARELHRDFIAENGAENVRNLFVGKKTIPGALLYLQTATAIQFVEGPTNTVLRYSYVMDEELSDADLATLAQVNDAIQHHAT
ncbi:MAG TPA: hypothetical protein VEP30_00965 [Chthoniobacterales bacterium]|nr:hypothetical protein [Chthoniobacterales bacterium]